MKTYQDTLDWMFSKLPMYQRIGKRAYKPNMESMLNLDNYLCKPHKSFKSIHIAGTNGKGSTSHLIASALQSSGYKVGLYTSPHLMDFRERIKINGNKIPHKEVIQFITEHKNYFELNRTSFFEMTVGMAFTYFKYAKVDYAIIEVGLGGRLDATNIISPLVSVITNISYDHTEILGDTLELISTEKAGIIKEKSKLVVGEKNEITNEIFINVCKEKLTEITFAPDISKDIIYSDIEYLNKNIHTSIQACKSLNLNALNDKVIQRGIDNVKINTGLFGRWSLIEDNPMIIFDSAHNESGFKSLANQISKMTYNKIYILLSFVKGKKIKDLIRHLPKDSNIYFTSLKIERSMDLEEINLNFTESIKFDVNSKRIFNKIKTEASKDDLILITGSNYIAKEIFNEN